MAVKCTVRPATPKERKKRNIDSAKASPKNASSPTSAAASPKASTETTETKAPKVVIVASNASNPEQEHCKALHTAVSSSKAKETDKTTETVDIHLFGMWFENAEATFQSGNLVVVYEDPEKKGEKTSVYYPVTYMNTGVTGGSTKKDKAFEEYLEAAQTKKDGSLFMIFSTAGVVLLRTPSASSELTKVIDTWLTDSLGFDPYAAKASAVQSLAGSIKSSFVSQMTHFTNFCKGSDILKELEDELGTSKKTGTLKVKIFPENKKEWTEHQCYITREALLYFRSSKDDVPSGILPLTAASVELDVYNVQADRFIIRVHTPLCTLELRTRNDAALADWIVGLEMGMKCQVRDSQTVLNEIRTLAGTKVEERQVADFDASQFMFLKVTIGPKKKTKEYGLPKSKTNAKLERSLGREDNNDIVILDDKVSRSHAKVEYTNVACTMIDMGGGGCKLNGASKKFATARLQVGDKIAMGDSIVELVLKAKGKMA